VSGKKFPRYDVGQVVMDKINNVPRKIDRRAFVRAYSPYYAYTFQGTGLTLSEEALRPLTDKEIGADWSRL
jgi:hypothetical protein